MDISGNNRYELLFMDDDSVTTPSQGDSPASNSASKKTASATKRNVDKENKSGALNKSNMQATKSTGQVKPKAGSSGNAFNNIRFNKGVDLQKAVFKSQNDVPKQNNVRRNVLEGGSNEVGFSTGHRESRQLRDRVNRVPPRNREAGYRGGKREFDRQSGSDKTGVKAIDKRDGAGAHNWGSVKQEIEDLNKSTADTDAPSSDKEESSNEQTSEQPAVPEEEIKELTLDEWKAMRGERAKPQYNLRKANEGEDTSEWKKMIMLNKKKGDSEEEYEYDPSMYPQRVGRLQRIVDIQFNFNDGRRGGFGKGRVRGSHPGGDLKSSHQEGERQFRQQRNFGDKQQKRSPKALKVDDERQFPTLS